LIVDEKVRSGEVFEIEPAESGSVLAHLPWWLILTVAMIVTELTAHPSIGVTVLCLKFGWNDFRTALWLRRRDLNRRRGAICSWFYFSSGLWRVCVWSFGLMFLIVMVVGVSQAQQAGAQQVPNNAPMPPTEIMTCMIVWLISSAMATFLTLVSVWLSRHGDVKVWISGSVSESRRQNRWPPRPTVWQRPETNLLRWWLILTAIAVFVPSFIVGVTVLATLGGRNPGQGGNWAAWVPVVIMTVLFLGAFFVLIVGGRQYERLGAISPWHCWPDNKVQPDSDSSD
jgi:hypothetical protein